VQRAKDLQDMFSDGDVRAIVCSRGGYGSARLLPHLDFGHIADNKKIFVGYSDITALQMAIVTRANLVCFSGPMVAVEMARGLTGFTEKHFWNIVQGKTGRPWRYHGDRSTRTISGGRAGGRLLGGCFSVLMSLLETGYIQDLTGALLFVEDIAEPPYKIDRYLMQLKLSGVLSAVNGIIFGRFVDCTATSESPAVDEVVEEYVSELGIPVLLNWPYGHSDDMYTMPVGVEAILDADNLYLEFPETAVL
jgi:muramoyltetrapeptide carboxypeptidase